MVDGKMSKYHINYLTEYILKSIQMHIYIYLITFRMLSSKFSILSVEADVKGRGEPKPLFNDFVTAARTPSLGSVLKNTFINIYIVNNPLK